MKNNKLSEEERTQLKEAVKEALMSYDSNAIIQMLVQQGYDPFYAQSIVEEAEEEDTVIPNQNVEDTSEADALEQEQQTQVQEEEDALEATRKQMLAEQQQMADEDAEADVMQDMEEQEYFNFAMGGMPRAQFGIDVNPMPNAQFSQGEEQPYITWPTMEGDLMRDGGMPSKRSFLKKMTKHLIKANMGMEQASKMPSPYGDINNPTASDVSGKKNFISALNKQTQMFQAKQQAEQMYNNMYGMMAEGGDTTTENPFAMDMAQFGPPADQHDPLEHLHSYGESLTHELPLDTSMESRQFGGAKNRRIKRANRALFGVPFMPPGTSVDYEFGPLGGLRKASAETDLAALSQLFNMLPGSPNANPFVTLPGMARQAGYRMKVTQGRLVEKEIEDINNQSIKEVATETGNQTAEQKSAETPTINTSNVIPQSTPVRKTPPATKPVGTKQAPVSQNKISNKANLSKATESGLPPIGKRPKTVKPKPKVKPKVKPVVPNTANPTGRGGSFMFEEGGFVDVENPDLYKFIYGGDDISIPYINNTDMYREGGRILPQAQPGMSSFDQFRLQKMNPDGTLRNAPSLPGSEELMGNPYRQPQQQPVVPSSNQNQPVWNPEKTGYRDPYSGWDGTGSMPWITSSNAPGSPWKEDPRQQMNPQMQQYMQYMQMMSGNQMMGNPFAFGAPRGLGLGRAALKGLTGLSRDFNYFTGANPANWNIPEGYTKLRTETSKDRGKWYNPFDTKRVTTYEYTKPGEAGAPGAKPKEPENAPGYNPKAAGPGYSGYNADSDGNTIPDYLQASGPGMMPGTPTAPNDLGRRAERAIRRGERRSERQRGSDESTGITPMSDADYMARVQANRGQGADANLPTAPRVNTGTGMSGIFEGLDVPGANPYKQPTPANKPLYAPGSGSGSGMYNVMGDFEDGGYVPDYYTFDGYLPMAGTGIVSDTPDFQAVQDPNAIKYTVEEQSGWSWDPKKLGNAMSVGSNMVSSVLEDLQSVKNKRFGSNKQNYARDIDRELAYRGVADQEGNDKKVGYKTGRTYSKYGGAQYKDGGTYSLTQAQIDQIRKMGGDVEFI